MTGMRLGVVLMRTIACLPLLQLFAACGNEAAEQKAMTEAQAQAGDTALPLHLAPSTEREVRLCLQLPRGFRLDTIYKADTLLNHRTSLYIPVSATDEAFNKKLGEFIAAHEKDYEPDEKGDAYQSSTFELWLSEETQSDKKLSFKFLMQSYYPGAAHYNWDSATFVYRLK